MTDASLPDPPVRIGPYRLLERLGEGGIGEVWLAQQDQPVRRRVALKLVKPGMDTRQVLARLEAERQALAVMDHPNIAQFFDGGATEAGRPYFVMELVPGVPITEYCDVNRLSTSERLQLFGDVCKAVQHAHQKGVVHRDLKPSNVLVTVQDQRPMVKVIDFGIAKALGHDLTERTLVTRLGQVIGTPEYMSPEQAEGSGLDVDTRSDIYSLGVMLYELLVGTLPFDVAAVAFHAIRHAIRETDVPRPSARLTTLGDAQETVALHRRTTAQALRKELRTDLDWIILKAMEKDRTRRYETPNALALDLHRHLNHEPVLARAPSTAYRINKFVRRHRVGVAATATIAALLVLSTVGMSVQAARIARERDRAELEAAKAKAVNDFLQTMLAAANPWVGAREVRVVDVLDRAAREVDLGFGSQPELEATVRTTLGRTYRGLGLVEEAEAQVRQALDVRRRTLPAQHPELAESLNELGVIARYRGDYPVADSLFLAGLEMRRQWFGPEHETVSESLNNLGGSRLALGDYAGADTLLRSALAMRQRLLGEGHQEVSTTQSNLGSLLFRQGEFAEAEALFRDALATRRQLQGEHPDVVSIMNSLAITLQRLERFDEAEPLLRECLSITQRLLGHDHMEVARGMNNLAVFLWRTGEYAEADSLLRAALVINRRTLGESNPEVASNLLNLALVLRDQQRYAEAEPLMRQVVELRRRLLGNDHPQIAESLNNYGALLVAAGRHGEAEGVFRESERIQIASFGEESWQAATSRSLLGDALLQMGRYREAEPLLVSSHGIIQAEFGDDHGRTRAALGRVLRVYEALGDSVRLREYGGGAGGW
jgi:eukaryotic-like serine/threonine-protein kinase